jgi:hypothetical protein
MATNRQVIDEIRHAPGFVTVLEFKQKKLCLQASAATSKERLNGQF